MGSFWATGGAYGVPQITADHWGRLRVPSEAAGAQKWFQKVPQRPPNGIKKKFPGSCPFSIETNLIAPAILAFATLRIASAASSIDKFSLFELDLTETTLYAHFGRDNLPYERLDLF